MTIITDHKPLCAVFNGNKSGTIRTERYKQRNQDIKFKVIYQTGKNNQTDFLSRRAIPIVKRSEKEQQLAEDTNNLLYTLHTTPIIDKISLRAIAEETEKDLTLNKLQKIIRSGRTWIPKDESKALLKFQTILPEITITGNGILLKNERIILPESLQTSAITLAHQGSHPGLSSMERRLRFHFFFHDLQNKVSKVLDSCTDCKLFSNKNYKHPQKAHQVPSKSWEKVAVDLFGPMPSKNHVVVIQDLSSRFPEAKLVTSTSADNVLKALSQTYDAYGNPEVQLSDNGPPFNSASMMKFAEKRGIILEKTPPYHPAANPVETFMRPLGKAMKIAHHNGDSESKTLQQLLQNYRDTPHPATGIPPSSMLFRNTMPGPFPQRLLSEEDVETARLYDQRNKAERESVINSSKFKKTVITTNLLNSILFYCLISLSSETFLIMVENFR